MTIIIIQQYIFSLPHDSFLVDDLPRRNQRVFVITGTRFRCDAVPSIIQVGSLCTDTAVDGQEGEVTADICAADATTGATAGCHVVGVDHAARARTGILSWGSQTRRIRYTWTMKHGSAIDVISDSARDYSPQRVVLQPLIWIPAAAQAWTYEETAAHMQSSLSSHLQLSYMQFCEDTTLKTRFKVVPQVCQRYRPQENDGWL